MNRDLHARHPSERWGPVPSTRLKSLDPSVRWDDVRFDQALLPSIHAIEANT
jgi:hypothetical protein